MTHRTREVYKRSEALPHDMRCIGLKMLLTISIEFHRPPDSEVSNAMILLENLSETIPTVGPDGTFTDRVETNSIDRELD